MENFRIVITLLLFTIFLDGCQSASFVSSIKKQDFRQNEPFKLNITKLSIDFDSRGINAAALKSNNLTTESVMDEAKELYPDLFQDSDMSLPVEVKVHSKRSSSFLGALLLEVGTGTLLGGVLPLPMFERDKMTVSVTVGDAFSKTLLKDTALVEQKTSIWVSVLTPLALLSFPGESDLPKVSDVGPIGRKTNESYTRLLKRSIANAIVRTLKSGDMDSLAAAYRIRQRVENDKQMLAQSYLQGESTPYRDMGQISPPLEHEKDANVSNAYIPLLPKAKLVNRDAVAVIIGNRSYSGKNADIPDVTYAHNDADAIKQYLCNTLGYRDGNILFLKDATQADLVSTFGSNDNFKGRLYNWVKSEKSDVFVYYSGHGAPGLSDGYGYLLPVDANPMTVELNGYQLNTLYNNLSKIPARSLTVVLDACFSGSSQGGSVVRNASSISLKRVETKMRHPKGALLTAAGVSEVASWDSEAKLGLFTRHFLEGVSGKADEDDFGNGDGRVTLGELKKYLGSEVTYMARRLYMRDQNPQVQGSESMPLSGF